MNEWFKPEILIELFSIVGTCVAVYVAIRSDLAVLHEKFRSVDREFNSVDKNITRVESEVTAAHERIDSWYRRKDREGDDHEN
jgi:hypothetical protein